MAHAWWQSGVVYQIYPRSFQDSNGDGIGDLQGILQRLDYLHWLGIDAVWLSPVYPSPMADFGYDVADHCGIDPMFGSLADFDRLVGEVHRHGLRLILDYVPNHTSVAHPWFEDSRSSRHSAKRDWYIWRDPAPGGGPPTNWLSEFGGPAWTFDPVTDQYYYHAFLPQQPDLNWREQPVRDAMHAVMRFWLDRGVDGFRVDAIHMLVENESLTDNPPNPRWRPGDSPSRRLRRDHTADLPETQVYVAGMRRVLDEYPDRVLIGEAYLPVARLMRYYGAKLDGFHLPFNFHLISTPWQSQAVAALVNQYDAALPPGAWPNWVLGNHDKPRLVTRLGGLAQARLAALLLLSLRGTPTIYNGEEIGMPDGFIAPGQVKDPWEQNVPGMGLGRDPCRTPMLWDASANAGFTRGIPWLPITQDYRSTSVAAERTQPDSMLSLYRELLGLRRREPALATGRYRCLAVTAQCFVFERAAQARRLVIALNFDGEPQRVELAEDVEVLYSTVPGRAPAQAAARTLELMPFEGVIAAAISARTATLP